ncbi:MAG TPA: hypothetical protein VJ464_13560 [Blastocatellia bacterium]|nr:hypothetical protein [Blastocatellia bacterium]
MIRLGSVELSDDDLSCHVHCWGESGSGKSRVAQFLARTFTAKGEAVVFMDPGGEEVRDYLGWASVWRPRRPMYLVDTSEREWIVGSCPFQSKEKDPDVLSTTVKGLVKATMKAWGHNPLEYPRLSKLLRMLYFTMIEQGLPLTVMDCLLRYKHPARKAILKGCSIREEWEELYRLKPAEFKNFIESVENRMEMFRHPQLRRILSLKENSIDLEKIWDEGGVVLQNLQPSSFMEEEHNRIVGALTINQLVNIALRKTKTVQKGGKRLYLIVDECYKFITDDIKTILDQTRKYGLILIALHQRLDHLDRQTVSALQNAKTKIIFSTQGSPKPERHFEAIGRDGVRRESVMQNVPYFRCDHSSLRATLLATWMKRVEVDRRLTNTDYEKDLDEGDFLK